MKLPLEFVVVGVPRTPQTTSPKSRADWRNRVQEAARAAVGSIEDPTTDSLKATIVYFYSLETSIDVDNIAKPILDGMRGIIFEDDNTINELVVRKVAQLD